MTENVQAVGVDFHCHLDLYPDHEAAIARAEAARIYTLTVTTPPKAWARNHELTRHTRFVRAALGLHPQLVAERAGELPLWERLLSETRYVGEWASTPARASTSRWIHKSMCSAAFLSDAQKRVARFSRSTV